jgi:hypothetical protein
MKKVKTTIAAAVVLAACAGVPLFAAATGWYGPGEDGGTGYFNPAVSGEYDPYPFYNIVGGESFGALYEYSLPNQNESPFNPQPALTRHGVSAPHMISLSLRKKAAQIAPARSLQKLPPAAD